MNQDGPIDGLAGPTRMCVGCRSRAARSVLLRVVVVGGNLVPDRRATLPGRGAWLHRDLHCLDEAERRRAIPRALRVSGPLDTAAVRVELVQEDSTSAGTHREMNGMNTK
jgi:predicted RNA-binding protein YlxR (DUF448 family)